MSTVKMTGVKCEVDNDHIVNGTCRIKAVRSRLGIYEETVVHLCQISIRLFNSCTTLNTTNLEQFIVHYYLITYLDHVALLNLVKN